VNLGTDFLYASHFINDKKLQ